MKLKEVELEDQKEVMEMYKEYIISVPIPGIDRFEGIRDFEKIDTLTFEEWIADLEKNKDEKTYHQAIHHILYI